MTDEVSLADSATDNLYLALLQCFAIIICGYIAGRSRIISKSEVKGLNTFVGTFSLPALIFTSLAQLDLDLVNWKFLVAVTFAKAIVFFTVIIITVLISRPVNSGRAALLAIFATQSNDFAIGYPMIHALYGKIHPEYSAYLYLMAPISLAILNPIGFVLLELNKRQSGEWSCGWSLTKSTLKGIIFNPVLFMTVLGIIANLITSHKIPVQLHAPLKVFGDAFSASALFLLGLMMVGKIHNLKGRALVIPGILISVKLLALPLIIRESVNLISAGNNETDTRDLSTFGFLYGTLPTAPALFVFTLRYNIDVDLIASAMVACTFLSAPLMFVSAKMIDAISSDHSPDTYAREISAFALDTSAASTAACCWLLVCFFAIGKDKYKRVTHRITVCLVISQLITSIGVIIWSTMDKTTTKSALWYAQFLMITGGVYASRLWTAVLAATLLFLSSRSLSFIFQLQKWILPIGWGLPILLVSLMAALITPSGTEEFDKGCPNFQLGRVQAAISVFILVFCFIVTLGCLVLQQRYQRRSTPLGYSSLNTSLPDANGSINVQRNVVDVEDLMSQTVEASRYPCELNNGCANGIGCSTNRDIRGLGGDEDDNFSDDERETEEVGDLQVLRHLVLLILLLCSMFVGLALSIGTLVMEQLSGVYAELAFLDVALNLGQSLIAFATFGLDPGLGALGKWVKKLCDMFPRTEMLRLPEEEALTPETRNIREEFAQRHLAGCRTRIAACRRRLLRVYREVFTGTDLVDWLLEAGLATDREAAVKYGRCLLDARVLCHIDGTEHFHDRNLLYTFRT